MTATIGLPSVFVGRHFDGDGLTKYARDLSEPGTLWQRVAESGSIAVTDDEIVVPNAEVALIDIGSATEGEVRIAHDDVYATLADWDTADEALWRSIHNLIAATPGLRVNVEDDWIMRCYVVRWRIRHPEGVDRNGA